MGIRVFKIDGKFQSYGSYSKLPMDMAIFNNNMEMQSLLAEFGGNVSSKKEI